MATSDHAAAATELVERARAGDRGAFDELVRRYRGRIVALALHLSGSATDAEDITQEVFLKAFLKLGEFEGRSHFFTWVYRMAINRSLNVRRDQARRREELGDPRIERAVAIDAPGDPQRAAELRQTYARLLTELDRLPAEMRTSVVLVALQGLSHGEAAVVQECSPGTIAWRIHEARKRLRDALEPPTVRVRRPGRDGLSKELASLRREWLLPVPPAQARS
jgi:RNA polymerase sigma-70 factor, ECF subfamily